MCCVLLLQDYYYYYYAHYNKNKIKHLHEPDALLFAHAFLLLEHARQRCVVCTMQQQAAEMSGATWSSSNGSNRGRTAGGKSKQLSDVTLPGESSQAYVMAQPLIQTLRG